jgi:hypothetical protein
VEPGVPRDSPVSPILFAIHTAGLIRSVEERVQPKGHWFVDYLGWVATGKDMNQVVARHVACAVESIEWASRRDFEFNTAKKEAALFTHRRGHKKHLQPKLKAKIKIENGVVRFNKEPTQLLGFWMEAHLTFKVHHNRCMKKTRAAEAQLCVLRKMHGIIPVRVRANQIASVEAIALCRSELRWDPKEIGQREKLQLLLNQQARSTLGALPTTPMGPLMR